MVDKRLNFFYILSYQTIYQYRREQKKIGDILSMMDREYLTALRTRAASGLATKYFAREDGNIVAIFACGAQGKTQLLAIDSVREIIKVRIYEKALLGSFVQEVHLFD